MTGDVGCELGDLGELPPGTLILGIGNRMRGDDAAGPAPAEECAARGLDAIDCGAVPENFLGLVERARPPVVLLADAADFGGRPGEIAVFTPRALAAGRIGTHGMPLDLLAGHIAARCGARVAVLAFQPRDLRFASAMSAEVSAAVKRAAALLAQACLTRR